MVNPVLAQIPAHLQNDPTIYRVGMLLFRQGAPGIVAHLQETGVMHSVVSTVLNSTGNSLSQAALSANPVGAALNVASKGAAFVAVAQNEQIKTGIALLQSLQMINLAVTGVGIGVSVISHKLLSDKLAAIQQRLQGMDEKLERIARAVGRVEDRPIWEDLTDLGSEVEKADDAWLAGNATAQWERCADRLHTLRGRFYQQAIDLSENDEPLAALPFIDAFAMASSNMISCRLAIGDDELARKLSADFDLRLRQVASQIGVTEIVTARLRSANLEAGSPEYVASLEPEQKNASGKVELLREREAAAQSLPIILNELREKKINGRAWLEQARSEKTSPVLMLPTD